MLFIFLPNRIFMNEKRQCLYQQSVRQSSVLHESGIICTILAFSLIFMYSTLLHMSFLFYTIEILSGCPDLYFILTTDNQKITTMIWSQLQIKNPNCLVEAMLLIVLSPDPNMQAKRKSVQQELDMDNGYNILETKKKSRSNQTKYVYILERYIPI